ncbi:MAG: PQQ-binding-like beta-propeller repeat protein [bacterium]
MKKQSVVVIIFMSACILKAFAGIAKTLPQNPSWPIFRGDSRLSGLCDVQLPDDLHLLWSKKIGEEIKSSPVIGHGRIYIGSDNGKVYALSLMKGETLWEFATGDMIEASPLLVGHTVFVGSLGGTFYALSANDGKLQWSIPIGSRIAGSANWLPSPDGGSAWIFIGSYDNTIYCIDSHAGKKVWAYKTDNYINGTPSVHKGKVIFGGCDAKVHVVSSTDGKAIGIIDTGSYIPGSIACADTYAFVGNYANTFLCIDILSKKIVWAYGDEERGSPFFSSPAISGDRAVIGCRDGFLYCINRKNGKRIWSFRSRGEIDSSPIICGDKVVVGSNDGRVYMLSLADGKKIWSYEIGAAITSTPAAVPGTMVISAEDGLIYAFGAQQKGVLK